MEEQEDGSFAATVHNAQPKALGAWLVAAAYDVRGAMVDLQSSYVGLTGNTSKTYDLRLSKNLAEDVWDRAAGGVCGGQKAHRAFNQQDFETFL